MSNVVVKNLGISFSDKTIFKDFDIAFEENKINVILGPSGIGKTTLLNAIASMIPYTGDIEGADNGISYIFQKDRLIPSISVYKNLDMILQSICKDKQKRKNDIEKMLDLLEIKDIMNSLPTKLSGGQLQRVAMARAFLYPSSVLLLDEPFKALDTALKSRIIKELIRLNSENPRTVIFVTHAIDECLLCAQKYYVFGGSPVKIITDGEIESDPATRQISDENLDIVRGKLLKALF